jgi:hypothetical protein
MALSDTQISAGRAVQRSLARVETKHRNCPEVRALHDRLAALVASFRDDLTDDQFQAFGGGSPKTPDDD